MNLQRKSTKDQNYFTFIDGALPYHQDQVRFNINMDEVLFNNLFKILI